MYDILLAAINAKFPDNNQELITPEWARDAFLYAVQSLGIKSDFRGLAPLACPEATPDEKCWYITDHDQTLSADVEFTGYGANKTVRKGEQWMVYWDGSQWEWLFLGSSFVNLNYGVNSLTKMLIPATSTPYDEDNPRTFYFLSDASAADYIVRLILDGESVEVADYVTLYDSNAHTLFIEFDAHYGAYTPTCFDGVAAGIVTLPMGVSRFSAGVGVPTTVVGLPDTINYIDADAITSTNASSIQLMGAPPKLDGDIDWSYISMLILPYQYKMLYSANAVWQAAVDAIITAGGSVYLDDTTTYDPTDDHATDSHAGIVELATDGEAQAGTDTSKAVTPHGLASAISDMDGVLLVTINNDNTASHSRDEIVQAVTDGKAVVMKLAINGNIIPVTVKYTETVAKLERVRIESAGSGSPYNRISLDTYNIDNSKNVSTGYNHSYASVANTNAQRDTLTLTVTAADFSTAVSQSKLNQGCIYRLSDTGAKYLATSSNTYELLVGDATDTAKGVVELATSAEAEAGTDSERVLTPKTNRDAHDAWHWFGTQAEFKALEDGGQLSFDKIYHVENTEDTGITLHWTDDVATLASNNQLVTGDMYAKLPTGDTDKRNITNLYMATSSSTYITLWNL